ncbi:MAG: GMC family oxidoreductase N-terminal domain-containing protein [Myxococcales bacterium]
MSDGHILIGSQIEPGQVLTPDVCIVGSGAGGAVTAHELARRGKRVLVLEEGGYFTRRDFRMREDEAFPRLYQEKGMRATADLAITILQGRAVGGTTVVNWTTSFRTPAPVLAHWRDVHGVEGLSPETLNPHWDAIEARLNVHEWPLEQINANNRVLWDGCGKLGWHRELLRRNVKTCMASGYCGMGCPIDAKQSMLVTYLPDAVAQGAVLYANTRVERLEVEGRRVTALHASVCDPDSGAVRGTLTVKPKLAVLSGGAINTPALLLRSGLDGGGRVGRRTFLHPVVAMAGLFAGPIEAYYGAPQSVASHQFAERAGRIGFFLETPPIHPMLAALSFSGFGRQHQEVLAKLPHVQALIGLAIDGFLPGDEGGTVSLKRDGRVQVDYPMKPHLWEALREACKAMARIQLAAGARSVASFHNRSVVIEREADVGLLDAAEWEPNRVNVFTAHQMGGCAMGRDPKRSVVDSRLRFHTLDNLFVVDGSVLPTSLGVNPQETIYGLARWASGHIAETV